MPLCSILNLVSDSAGLVYHHALRSTVAVATVHMPCLEDAHLCRLESLCFLHATQFGFVRGTEECSMCGFRWVIRRAWVWSRNCGQRDRHTWMMDVWYLHTEEESAHEEGYAEYFLVWCRGTAYLDFNFVI